MASRSGKQERGLLRQVSVEVYRVVSVTEKSL